jgi:phenylpyruvate tautomerase PptA (4-oxalocrotonate tautomerase family)
MPFARIDLVEGRPPQHRQAISDVVYEAMIDALNALKDDRFQVITEHPERDIIADPNFFGIRRTNECIFVQVTMNEGRSLEQKKTFYRMIADGLHERIGLRREDVLISLVEVKKENWSFGNGVAQYAE